MKYFVKIIIKFCFLKCGPVFFRNYIDKVRHKSSITVLTYHRIDVDNQDVNALSPDIFERQMIFLKNRYKIVSIDELFETFDASMNNRRCVVITFDDGYLDNIQTAAPILMKYKLPACFFVSSGIIDNGGPFPHDIKRLKRNIPVMTWTDIKNLNELGFEIGGHSVNHVRLSDCDDESLQKEIVGCKKQIEKHIGREIKYFSHPHGKMTDVSPNAIRVIQSAGFRCNFSSYGGLVSPKEDLYDIKRMSVPNDASLLLFEAQIEGWKVRS